MASESPERPRRARGVRLSDLDRSKVYRIAHSGRRWEVLGEDPAPDAPGAPDGVADSAAAEGASTSAAPPPPPAAPDGTSTERS